MHEIHTRYLLDTYMFIQTIYIELPAGFKDDHETDPAQSALRELKEETGYVGENAISTYAGRTDPWKSNERDVIVYVDVDLEKEENKNPVSIHTSLQFFKF